MWEQSEQARSNVLRPLLAAYVPPDQRDPALATPHSAAPSPHQQAAAQRLASVAQGLGEAVRARQPGQRKPLPSMPPPATPSQAAAAGAAAEAGQAVHAMQNKSGAAHMPQRRHSSQNHTHVMELVQAGEVLGRRPYLLPYWDYVGQEVEGVLEQLLGRGALSHVVRMSLMRKPPTLSAHLHRDVGPHALRTHRIYVPLVTAPGLALQVCPQLDRRLQGAVAARRAAAHNASAPLQGSAKGLAAGDCVQVRLGGGEDKVVGCADGNG